MLSDFRAAVLSFRRNPWFVAAVVATLSLGIAPNCVIFAVMDAVYFRPLPYPAQQRLVLLNLARPSKAALDPVDPFTFAEWQRHAAGFERLAAYRSSQFSLNSGDRPERFAGQRVTPGFFRALGVEPSLGRGFRESDAAPGAPPVLVVSHRTWLDYFSGRADIVGLGVRLNGIRATVVGVMPARFTSFMEGRASQVWAPMAGNGQAAPGEGAAGNVIGRLAPGSSLEAGRAALQALHAGLAAQFPDFYRDRTPSVRDFRASLFGGLGPGIRMLSVMVGLLLLIACGNAANLLLGRASQRTREVAIRMALGARRAQVIRGLLVESLLLALAAALLGLVLAFWGTRFLWARTAPIFQAIGVQGIAFSGRVLIFAVLLTVLVTALFGTLPALRASRVELVNALKDGSPGPGRGSRRARMSRALVVGQVALCVLTMIGATLVLRSVVHFSNVSANPGFRPQGFLLATLPQPGEADALAGAAVPGRAVSRLASLEAIAKRLAALPAVECVALVDRMPYLEAGAGASVSVQQAGSRDPGLRLDAAVRAVSGQFFRAMSMRLQRGRLFTEEDDDRGAPVAIVSDRLAAAHWKGRDPVGDRVEAGGAWRTIVGVVASSVQPTPFQPAERELFVPFGQAAPGDAKVLIQSPLPVGQLAAGVRGAVRAVDPDQPADLQSLEQALDRFMTPFRLILVLTVAFASIALGLAAVGLYAVVAHGVSRRTREMGIRMALGAGRAEVVGLVLRDGFRLALVGLAVGLLPGLALAKILPSEILGVGGLSVVHYGVALLLWLGASVTACLPPARRAARADPMAALRCE